MKKVLSVLCMLFIATLLGGTNIKIANAATTVKSLEIKTLPEKCAYNVGEGYSTKGLVVVATLSDGTTQNVDNSQIKSYSGVELTEGRPFQQAGLKSVELQYNGAKTTYSIVVFDPAKEYFITYDSDGGSAVEAKKIDASTQAFDLPKPTKKGAEFLGWYLDNTKYTKYQPGMGIDVKLKARWGYKITFNANGGTGKMKDGVISDDYNLPKSGFKKSGYKFVGWSTKKAADYDSFYQVGDSASYINVKNKGVTLYAQWVQAKSYKISYTTVKGVKLPSKAIKKYTAGKTTELPYPEITSAYPSKSEVGVTFAGWKITVNGKNIGTYMEIPPYISGDLKLTPIVADLEG